MAASLELVEVGPRDGFQSVGLFIPTETKIEILGKLHAAGLRRMEVTSFVSQTALPQLADAEAVLAAAKSLPGLNAQVLTPTRRHAERALAAGADHIAFVLSVSEAHNRSNVRRSPSESAADYEAIADMCPDGTKIRLNLATAFDCPYDGPVAMEEVVELLKRLVAAAPQAEIALCDTTGRVAPSHVSGLFARVKASFPSVSKWAFHGHDTFGLGTANTYAAYIGGVRVFDASVAGLGGCPFAPGATGNVATEDLVWMFDGMDLQTGVDLELLAEVAREVTQLPGAQTGGRVREALHARACRDAARETVSA